MHLLVEECLDRFVIAEAKHDLPHVLVLALLLVDAERAAGKRGEDSFGTGGLGDVVAGGVGVADAGAGSSAGASEWNDGAEVLPLGRGLGDRIMRWEDDKWRMMIGG